MKRVKNGRVLLIPASDQTAGHGTTAQARFWKQELGELLQSAPAAQSAGGSLGGQTKRSLPWRAHEAIDIPRGELMRSKGARYHSFGSSAGPNTCPEGGCHGVLTVVQAHSARLGMSAAPRWWSAGR